MKSKTYVRDLAKFNTLRVSANENNTQFTINGGAVINGEPEIRWQNLVLIGKENLIWNRGAFFCDIRSKLDKSGGVITGNLTVNGHTKLAGTFELPTGGNKGTVLDIPGNLGIGSKTDTEVTGRIQTYRKVASNNDLVCTKSSIGYNPIQNVANTHDYGMKYQIQYNTATTQNIDKADSGLFYLSYNGCIIGYSGDPTKKVTTFYTVLHDGNAYYKDEVDEMIGVLREENENLKTEVKRLYKALEMLGVDMDSVEVEDEGTTTFGIDIIEDIQTRERGFYVGEDWNCEE